MKQRRFIIVTWSIYYGTASTNRLLAYADAAARQGYETEVVTLLRLSLGDFRPGNGVTVRGLLPCRIQNGVVSKLVSFFSTIGFLLFMVRREDRLLLYGSAEYLPLFLFLRRRQTFFEVTECPDLTPPKCYPFIYYMRLWKKLEGIFVISSNLKCYFVERGVNPERVHIINMIVDSARFCGIERKSNGEKFIAYCGNVFNDSKDGLGDLFGAFAKYHEAFTDRKLYIIGPIAFQALKEEYDNRLQKAGLAGQVVFTGSVSPSAILQYFVDAEMLILARPDNIQAKYGFPTKLGEYLLSGRPVVVTDVGNISDFLSDGQTAFVARPGDIDNIAQKMADVSSDPSLATTIGQAGKAVALSQFNSKIETEKLLSTMFSSTPKNVCKE